MIFGMFPSFPLETSLNWPAILSLLLPSCQTKKTNNWEVMGSLSLSQKSSLPPGLVCSDQDPQRKDNAAVAAAQPAVTDN